MKVVPSFGTDWKLIEPFIVSIACYKGMQTKGGAAGVGKETTRSVVTSYAAILFANFLLTIGLNSFYWTFLGP